MGALVLAGELHRKEAKADTFLANISHGGYCCDVMGKKTPSTEKLGVGLVSATYWIILSKSLTSLTLINTHTHTEAHVQRHMFTYTQRHTHTYKDTYTHTHMYIHSTHTTYPSVRWDPPT